MDDMSDSGLGGCCIFMLCAAPACGCSRLGMVGVRLPILPLALACSRLDLSGERTGTCGGEDVDDEVGVIALLDVDELTEADIG